MSAVVTGSASHWWASSRTITYEPAMNRYRCVLVSGTATGTAKTVSFLMASADAMISYAGNGSASMFLEGMQAEDSAVFASSYIPTTTAPVARVADVLSYPVAANLPRGTGAISFTVDIANATAGVIGVMLDGSLSGGTRDGPILYYIGQQTGAQYKVANVTVADLLGSVGYLTASRRIMMTYAPNDFRLYGNGSEQGARDTDGATSIPGSLFVGANAQGGQPLFGHIRGLYVFNTALTPLQVQMISSALGAP